jgi:hypothetical protein
LFFNATPFSIGHEMSSLFLVSAFSFSIIFR